MTKPRIAHVRVARQTDRLEACVAFYRDVLGLEELGRFSGHHGYTGVLFALRGSEVHLELTQHDGGSPASEPAPDDLLVLYLDDEAALDAIAIDQPLELENPYWAEHGARGVADPDGRVVVLVPHPFGRRVEP